MRVRHRVIKGGDGSLFFSLNQLPLLTCTKGHGRNQKSIHEHSFMILDRFNYLVDPASSHMLVSKIKPCMSKYKQIYTVKLRMAH
jgi:hypothetical protein